MPPPPFDRSLLPPADLEFVVVSDTHYMIDVGDAPLEFESRRRQGERAGAAWRAIAGLDPAFVVHLGDMVQEFPGRPDYDRAVGEALDQIRGAGLWERCRFAAGNHDIGDRPDPTMPTGEASEESLDTWERRHGPSWQAWDAAGVRFVVLNSQLFNTGLAAHARQRAWLEAQLAESGCRPCVLFLHMPPYLADPGEPWLGHYDNLGEPDRGWLLDLVRRHRVLAMFAGHVHFQFFDHVAAENGVCRYHVTPSPSFTRPGFSHLFTSAPPPEQGRDDEGKLGFFLCRMAGGRLDVHRLRMAALQAAGGGACLVTPLPAASEGPSRGGPGFASGVTLRHALAPRAEVPLAWPSVIRQPVRNDYPLLACLEMGVTWVRAPLADLADPVQARRLEVLRAEGVRVQAVALGEEEALARAGDLAGVDALEVQLPGRLLPETRSLAALGEAAPLLVLAPVLPGQPVPGKQHHRTRIGFAPEELDDLGGALEESGLTAAAACRLDPADPWETARLLQQARGRRGWQLQLLAEMPGVDDGTNANCVARAMLAAASLDVPLFLEPLVDLDRTMDVARGLLDTRCNPRPPFDVARCLGPLLRRGAGRAVSVSRRGSCEIASLGDLACLVIVEAGSVRPGDVLEPPPGPLWSCRLAAGAVTSYEPWAELTPEDGPLLVIRRAD
ncbi:MAG: metallophosphoesterase [Gemmatimonadaceae bacterium]|nr:metallophosphoesterase [Gemmatimonadaceae bacterium]